MIGKKRKQKGVTCSECNETGLNECDCCGEALVGQGDLPYTGQGFWCLDNFGHSCGNCVHPADEPEDYREEGGD